MYSHNLEKDLFENCSNYVISKDKIKAKIEELNKEMLKENKSLEQFYKLKYCYEVLQELLEEEG